MEIGLHVTEKCIRSTHRCTASRQGWRGLRCRLAWNRFHRAVSHPTSKHGAANASDDNGDVVPWRRAGHLTRLRKRQLMNRLAIRQRQRCRESLRDRRNQPEYNNQTAWIASVTSSYAQSLAMADANISDPPTIGSDNVVAVRSTVSCVPGSGHKVKSRSLEKIINPICWPDGMI